MAFFFAYTQVRNNDENLGFTAAISFCLVSYPFLSLPLSFTIAYPWTYHTIPSIRTYHLDFPSTVAK